MSLRCDIRCLVIFAPNKAALSRSEAAFAVAVRDYGRFQDSDKREREQFVGSGLDAPG